MEDIAEGKVDEQEENTDTDGNNAVRDISEDGSAAGRDASVDGQ
jgi:hypothetical protein